MPSPPPLPNLLTPLWADVHDIAFLWQVAATAVCLLLAWLADRALRPRTAALENIPSVGHNMRAAMQFPVIALVLVQILRTTIGGQSLTLLDLMVALLTASMMLRLTGVMLRQVFAPSGGRVTLMRTITTVVWIGFALYVAGLLPELMTFLDGLGFSIGQHRLSLLLMLQGALSLLTALLIALWLGRLIEARAMAATDLDISLRVIISKLAQALLALAAILFTLPAMGIDLTVLSVFGGALGVGLGFGLQKIASNYVSGFIILMDRSVSLGDLVTIDKHTGQLTKMTARYVVLRSLTGSESIIPNDTLITSTVVNQSYSDKQVRESISIQAGYDSDLEHAMRLMENAAARQPRILKEPAPTALLARFADNGVELELGYWVDDPQTGTLRLRSTLQLDIWRAFRQHQIEIPYPQRVVRLATVPAGVAKPPE